MKLLLTYCFLLLSFVAHSNTKFDAANELYNSGDFEGAIEIYQSIISNGEHSADTYYNLGNAYYRNGELGRAIWGYESALKIQPGHEDALFNLEFSNAQTVEKIDTAPHGFGHWMKGLLFSSRINIWSYAAIASSILLSLFVILFVTVKSRRLRNMSLISGSLIGIILAFSVIAAAYHKSSVLDNSEAIVVIEQVDILVAPTEDAKTSFKLSEGVKVQLISEEGDWVQIELNSNQGWVLKESLLTI